MVGTNETKIEGYRILTVKTVKYQDPLYSKLDMLSLNAKRLYNKLLYSCRQTLFLNKNLITSYYVLERLAKTAYSSLYKSLPTQTSQQLIRLLSSNLKSFKALNDEYKESINGLNDATQRPSPPNYYKSKGRAPVFFTNQQITDANLAKGFIKFPKSTGIEPLKFNKPEYLLNYSFQELRIIPKNQCYKIELVFKGSKETPKKISGRSYASIDLGLDNLATIIYFKEDKRYIPKIINGKGLKSYNNNFNKKLSNLSKSLSCLNKGRESEHNKQGTSLAINQLYNKRSRVFDTFYHDVSTYIVNDLKSKEITDLIIGYNKGWKNRVHKDKQLSKKVSRDFVSIGYLKLINLLKYKCSLVGISVHLQCESYTSCTSFLDRQYPCKENYNKSIRIHRGCIKTSTDKQINADVNAAYQILIRYLAAENRREHHIDYKEDTTDYYTQFSHILESPISWFVPVVINL